MSFIIGLDLGQSQDYTALTVIERSRKIEKVSRIKEKPGPFGLDVRHLERFPLGTIYPAIVDRVKALVASDVMSTGYALVVDQTGVGRPVVDMMRQAHLRVTAVTITGGNSASNDGRRNYLVPKRELVTSLQLVLQSMRLHFAKDLPDLQTLLNELNNFQVTITEAANDTYGGRQGVHDDMVLAVCLAVWYAEVVSKNDWVMS